MSKTKKWIIGIIISLAILIGGFFLGKGCKTIDKDIELQKQVDELNTKLETKEKETQDLQNKLNKATQKRKAIKPPKTELEVIERSKALGYLPL